MRKWLQKKLIGYLVKDLFKAITVDDILQLKGDKNGKIHITYQDKIIDADRMMKIIEDAEVFENSFLWKLLENNIRHASQNKMFPQSNVDNDLLFGKAMLYNLKVIKDTIEEIKKFKL